MLVDDFDRIHDYLRISLTDKCNLRCSYCIPYDLPAGFYARSKRMSAEEIENIASVFVQLGIKKIRLTGGEPLVRNEAARIIQLLSKHPVELGITTNGVLVDEYIPVFKEAGISSVNVSLDSLDPGKYFSITKRNKFEKVFSNIHLLLQNNFQVKINMVVIKGVNDDEISAFVQLTENDPLQVRFIEFMPFDKNSWEREKVFSQEQMLDLLKSRFSFIKLQDEKNDTAKKFQVENYKGNFAIISAMSKPFCCNCNRLRLTSDGKLMNCLFSKEEFDLLTPLRNGEDLIPIIQKAVGSKKEKQGRRLEFNGNKIKSHLNENRSMVSIGG